MESTTESTVGSRVAKNTTYLTLALIGQKILSFLYVLLLARLVGITITGDYFSALSFTTLFTIFIDLGLTQAFIRQTARDQKAGEEQLPTIISFKLITGVVVAAALLGFMALLTALGKSHPDTNFVRWAALVMVIDSLTSTLYAYFRGIQRLEYESFGTILHRVMVMIVGLAGLQLGAPPLVTIWALLAGSLGNFLYAAWQLWRRGLSWRFEVRWKFLRPLLMVAAPFAVAGLFSAIYSSSDNVLLSIFRGRHDVGLYGLAYKVTIAFQLVPSALVAAIFPAMSASFIADRGKLERIFSASMQYLMVIVVPITLAIVVLAHNIVLIGWTKVWLDAVWPMRVLALGLPFIFLNFPVGYLLNASNQQTRNTINIGIVVVLNVAANLWIIGRFGYRGVAVDSVLGSVLLLGLGLWYIRRVIVIPVRALLTTLGKTLIAGLVMGLIGWRAEPSISGKTDLLLVAGAMAVTYAVLVFALRIVRPADLRTLVARFRRG